MDKERQISVEIDKATHKALRQRALDEDKKVKHLTNEILAAALGVKEKTE
jgi:hypothetical protein